MALIDQALAIEGIRRAWPCDGAIAVEVVDRYGRLRAGRVSDSGPVLSPYACDPVLGRIPVGDGTLVVHRHGRRAVVVGARVHWELLVPHRAPGVGEEAPPGQGGVAEVGQGASGQPREGHRRGAPRRD